MIDRTTIKQPVNWAKVVSLVLAIVPVVVLAYIVVALVIESIPALTKIELSELFGTKFAGDFSTGLPVFGLLPAIWGTVQVIVIAMAIAFPVSLAMAIISSEFNLGILGRSLRGLLGLLAGIPPIVYAIGSISLASLFIVPNFTGAGIPADQFPPPGLTWWTPGMLPLEDSNLLGGIMLSLLVIPFIAPLIDDALKNVPHDLKEASLALGATRWYTLVHTTLPAAVSGIISAAGLGALKAMGDVMIIAWSVGFIAADLPNPIWDVFERIAPLTSLAVALNGGFGQLETSDNTLSGSVAFFSGLLLLIAAFATLTLISLLQKRLKARAAR
jgi:phosphate transport system permease protein